MRKTEIQIWPIARCLPYARTLRRNDDAVDRMVAAFKEFRLMLPLLVRSEGEIVDGHLRLKAARKLQLTEVPVVLCDDWTPAQVKAFRLLVNRLATWAQWHWKGVAAVPAGHQRYRRVIPLKIHTSEVCIQEFHPAADHRVRCLPGILNRIAFQRFVGKD